MGKCVQWAGPLLNVLLLVACGALAVVALIVDSWHVGATPSGEVSFGLRHSCYGSACTSHNFHTRMKQPICSKDGGELHRRVLAVECLVVSAAVLSVLSLLPQLLWCAKRATYASWGGLCGSALGGACLSVAVAIASDTIYNWLYCGRPYCEMLELVRVAGNQPYDCRATVGFSFVAVVVAWALMLVAAIMGVVFVGYARRLPAAAATATTPPPVEMKSLPPALSPTERPYKFITDGALNPAAFQEYDPVTSSWQDSHINLDA